MLTAKIHTECKEYIWVLALEEGTSIAEKPLGMGEKTYSNPTCAQHR